MDSLECSFCVFLRNRHQNNPLVSAYTVCHSSTYITFYVFVLCPHVVIILERSWQNLGILSIFSGYAMMVSFNERGRPIFYGKFSPYKLQPLSRDQNTERALTNRQARGLWYDAVLFTKHVPTECSQINTALCHTVFYTTACLNALSCHANLNRD